MNIKKVKHCHNNFFEGPFIFEPTIFRDDRGLFFESWNKKSLNNLISKKVDFVQDNLSISAKGVLRGIHFQTANMVQGKLVRCSKGAVFDVIVDLRKSSKTFKYWGGIHLNSEDNYQLWIPEGFGHGFLSLEDESIFEYKVTNYWSKDNEKTLFWNDSNIKIIWPTIDVPYQLSQKDQQGDSFKKLNLSNSLFE